MKNKKLLNKITGIKKVDNDNFTITLSFENGKNEKISLAKYFSRPKGLAAEVIRGDMFAKCFVEAGALAWPNGLEFCADSLLMLTEEQKNQGVA